MMDQAVVGLADAIEALRAELMNAAAMGEGQTMQFSLEPVEISMQVAVSKDINGKIGWEVLGVGGGYEKVTTQTLTLRLGPLWLLENGTLTPDFAIGSRAFEKDAIGHDED